MTMCSCMRLGEMLCLPVAQTWLARNPCCWAPASRSASDSGPGLRPRETPPLEAGYSVIAITIDSKHLLNTLFILSYSIKYTHCAPQIRSNKGALPSTCRSADPSTLTCASRRCTKAIQAHHRDNRLYWPRVLRRRDKN